MNLFSSRFILFCSFAFLSCHSTHPPPAENNSDTISGTALPVKPTIAETRDSVSKKAVAAYSEKTDNTLNNWYFKVELFETGKTFDYRAQMNFEEIEGVDTIHFPNLGILPKPALKKGEEKYSCIIGFIDSKNEFRELKLVHVKNGNQLKLTPLRHYTLYEK